YDVVVVAAAGNADLNNYHIPFQEYPGDTEEAVSVIGLTKNSDGTVTRSSDSNYNVPGQKAKDICAPGSSIYSTTPNNTYGTLGGTSMASAEVSGVFALMFAARPSLTAPEAIGILYATAKDLGSAGWDEGYGYGEVDALAAVTQVQPWSVNISMDSTSFSYTGSAITPSVSVSLTDGTVLSEGTDYIVSYTSNVDAGTATATVVGRGAYKDAGFASKAFAITPASLSGASVTVAKKTNSYTGAAIKPGVTVKLGGKTLTASKDYTVSYQNNVVIGTATVIVKGKGNYKDSVSTTFTIVAAPSVQYRTHVQNVGWQSYVSNGATAGTSGRGLRLEAIQIKLGSIGYAGSIQYRTHVQNIGWESSWKSDGALSGTSGKGLRLEAIQIKLTGNVAEHYDVYYRVHAQNFGWLGWAKNGDSAGTAGYGYRLEAIQIKLVPKGGAAPGSTADSFKAKLVNYRTHVQNVGWQNYVYDGQVSGTSGQALRLEGINITLGNLGYAGSIQYMTHIQNIGWESSWKSNGALSGTSGRALRLEAIKVRLTGDMAKRYDVYYRVHAQNFGWLGWAKNGDSAGTAGYGYRLEAIQIKLVPKGGAAPGTTKNAFRQK
ncbi:MAG: S8 family serine peptidase, partial [Atopobiaceae bacterium]|nr:S8 family serine peptidase [Atopobiaceae bacterium]